MGDAHHHSHLVDLVADSEPDAAGAATINLPIGEAAQHVLPPVDADPAERPVVATGGGLADRLQARMQTIEAADTADFPLPGWDGEIILRARHFSSKASVPTGSDVEYIVASSCALVIVGAEDDGGDRTISLPAGWGEVAGLLGLGLDTPPGMVIRRLLADRPLWVGSLSNEIGMWHVGRRSELEELLGE